MRTTQALLAATLVVSAVACGDVKIKSNDGNGNVNAALAKRDSKPLGPGDLRISSTDSPLEVALIGDSLVAGLGASTRAKVSAKLDTTKVSGNGLGASIEKMVKSSVASALDHELHVPLTELSDIRYEDGLLVFYDKTGKRMHVMERNRDGRNEQTRFAEQDAKDFIALFKAKTGKV